MKLLTHAIDSHYWEWLHEKSCSNNPQPKSENKPKSNSKTKSNPSDNPARCTHFASTSNHTDTPATPSPSGNSVANKLDNDGKLTPKECQQCFLTMNCVCIVVGLITSPRIVKKQLHPLSKQGLCGSSYRKSQRSSCWRLTHLPASAQIKNWVMACCAAMEILCLMLPPYLYNLTLWPFLILSLFFYFDLWPLLDLWPFFDFWPFSFSSLLTPFLSCIFFHFHPLTLPLAPSIPFCCFPLSISFCQHKSDLCIVISIGWIVTEIQITKKHNFTPQIMASNVKWVYCNESEFKFQVLVLHEVTLQDKLVYIVICIICILFIFVFFNTTNLFNILLFNHMSCVIKKHNKQKPVEITSGHSFKNWIKSS